MLHTHNNIACEVCCQKASLPIAAFEQVLLCCYCHLLLRRQQANDGTSSLCLVQEYIRQMGACLLQLDPGVANAVESRLHQLTFEAIRLVGRRLRLNPSGHRALISSNASPAHAAAEKLQPHYYIHLLVCMLPLLPTIVLFSRADVSRQRNVFIFSHVSSQGSLHTMCPHSAGSAADAV